MKVREVYRLFDTTMGGGPADWRAMGEFLSEQSAVESLIGCRLYGPAARRYFRVIKEYELAPDGSGDAR